MNADPTCKFFSIILYTSPKAPNTTWVANGHIMSLPTDTLAKLYTVPHHRKKGSKKCNGHSVNTWDKMTNLIKNMYISSIYYNKIITIVNNKWNAVEHCTSYKICTANIFFSRLRIVHSCKFLLNVSSMYGMCLCGINDNF